MIGSRILLLGRKVLPNTFAVSLTARLQARAVGLGRQPTSIHRRPGGGVTSRERYRPPAGSKFPSCVRGPRRRRSGFDVQTFPSCGSGYWRGLEFVGGEQIAISCLFAPRPADPGDPSDMAHLNALRSTSGSPPLPEARPPCKISYSHSRRPLDGWAGPGVARKESSTLWPRGRYATWVDRCGRLGDTQVRGIQ